MQFEINDYCEDPLRLKWPCNDFYDLPPWESKEEELFPAYDRTCSTEFNKTTTTPDYKATTTGTTATATATDYKIDHTKTPLRKGRKPYDLMTPASSTVSLPSFKDTGVFSTPMQPLYLHTPFATPIEKEALKTGSNPFYSPPPCMRSPSSPVDKDTAAAAAAAAAAADVAVAAGVGAAPVLGLCEAFSSRSDYAEDPRDYSQLENQEFAPQFAVEPRWLSPPRSRTPSITCSLELAEDEAVPPISNRQNSISEPLDAPDKPFACSECPKSFRRMEHLRRHTKIHTQERPFACEVFGCNRQFSRSDNLKAHLKTHAKRSGRNIYVEGFEAHVCAEAKVTKRRRRGRD